MNPTETFECPECHEREMAFEGMFSRIKCYKCKLEIWCSDEDKFVDLLDNDPRFAHLDSQDKDAASRVYNSGIYRYRFKDFIQEKGKYHYEVVIAAMFYFFRIGTAPGRYTEFINPVELMSWLEEEKDNFQLLKKVSLELPDIEAGYPAFSSLDGCGLISRYDESYLRRKLRLSSAGYATELFKSFVIPLYDEAEIKDIQELCDRIRERRDVHQ